ncbi:hypothetical protein UVI_02007260 [Ustilaginoidea virens]|nr:hypothetical protein UVI_02007260 [Ustilaginoidea virens]
MHEKTSRLPISQIPSSGQSRKFIESYFDTALAILFMRDCELSRDFNRSLNDDKDLRWSKPELIARVVRIWDMIIDSSWRLIDSIHPVKQAEYTFKTRPCWWWDMHKYLDPRTQKLRGHFLSLSTTLDIQLNHAEVLEYPLSHALVDLPVNTITALQKALERELKTPAPTNFNPKASKRPITILSMSGYGGKAIAESLGQHLAFWNQADLIHLDAQDLSVLVGDYLGLNWAYTRGAVSMMGFRAAELNGKLVQEPRISFKPTDEDDAEADAEVIGIRSSTDSFEDELQKIRQGGYECFNRWENLKIDKIFEHVIRASEIKAPSGAGRRPVLLHLHDIVEMSMTLEGSILIGRLRALVDSAWQQGMRIAIIGTSSSENPSDEFQDTTSQLAAFDWVITRHLEINQKTEAEMKPLQNVFNLQKADYFSENIRNINRMIRALTPDLLSPPVLDFASDFVKSYLRSGNHMYSILWDSILPIPEVYSLARAFKDFEETEEGTGPTGILERCAMGPLRQKHGQRFLDEEQGNQFAETIERGKSHEEPRIESRVTMKLNEYEKKISSGQINRENLRTTFADVYAPPDTISALKLLTSLALVRPDAFTYGVLAQDRIPGCLLYGPPGTGKTMLAKAVAKESGANMLEISGATINDKWVGESEKLIRAVFTLAKRLEPCVVFIDEADSLLANRTLFSNRASHREHITQFLKEWDGLEETKAFIMVATNRPFDLDDAVLRRLPRKILVDLPLKEDRVAILRLLLRGESLDESVSLEELARRTPYYSGSDLKSMCVAAAMAAVEEENEAAKKHQGPAAYRYPERRILHGSHFESALHQIPASISEDMTSLKQIRKFDEEYGNGRKGSRAKSSMGFSVLGNKAYADSNEARIRP